MTVMVRRYDEPVEVLRRGERPAHFLWRGRLYAVRGVLDHWIETGAWWRSGTAGDPPTDETSGEPTDERPNARSAADERECWRVEASAGRASALSVFDLCFDEAERKWTLVRTVD